MEGKLYALIQKGNEKRVAVSELGGKGVFGFLVFSLVENGIWTPFGDKNNISECHYTSQAKMNADGWNIIATEIA